MGRDKLSASLVIIHLQNCRCGSTVVSVVGFDNMVWYNLMSEEICINVVRDVLKRWGTELT